MPGRARGSPASGPLPGQVGSASGTWTSGSALPPNNPFKPTPHRYVLQVPECWYSFPYRPSPLRGGLTQVLGGRRHSWPNGNLSICYLMQRSSAVRILALGPIAMSQAIRLLWAYSVAIAAKPGVIAQRELGWAMHPSLVLAAAGLSHMLVLRNRHVPPNKSFKPTPLRGAA